MLFSLCLNYFKITFTYKTRKTLYIILQTYIINYLQSIFQILLHILLFFHNTFSKFILYRGILRETNIPVGLLIALGKKQLEERVYKTLCIMCNVCSLPGLNSHITRMVSIHRGIWRCDDHAQNNIYRIITMKF